MSSCEFEDPSLTNISDQSNLTFLGLKRKNPRYKTNIEIEYDTSSKILIYEHEKRSIALTFEPNTAMVGLSEPYITVVEAIEPIINKIKIIEPIFAIRATVEPAISWMKLAESTLAMTRVVEPLTQIAKCTEPINKIVNILKPIKDIMKPFELINRLADNFELMSFTKLESEKEKIEEPDDFFILSNSINDPILSSEEEIDALLDELKNVKYNEELVSFFSEYENDIEDLTE